MPFELTIVTPEGEAFRGSAERVVLPGAEGDFGVLAGHVPFLTPLRVGEAEIQRAGGGGSLYAAVNEGFAEVTADRVVVMAETCELASDIDVARAERARERAERELAALRQKTMDEARFKLAQGALQRAVTRISVARHG